MQSIRIYLVYILFVGGMIVFAQPPTDLPRQYLVQRDFFNFFKAGEYSIMDPLEKQVYYRIESHYHVLQRLDVIRYPEKQKTANLNSKLHLLTYRGEISILNQTTNQWMDGKIEQNFRWFQTLYVIQWNDHVIKLTNVPGELMNRFRDENDELVADFRLQLSSIFWRKKYDLKVYTNKYPDEIYLLTLAAYDRVVSSRKG